MTEADVCYARRMEHRLRALLLLLVLLAAAVPAPAAAAQRLAVLTLTAPWTPDCQGVAWRKDRELRERYAWRGGSSLEGAGASAAGTICAHGRIRTP